MRHRYSKELLEPLIKKSYSWSEVCRKLNLKPNTGSQGYVKKRSNDFKIILQDEDGEKIKHLNINIQLMIT